MVIDSSRQQAMELTRNFCDAISTGSNQTTDFYALLWIVHWAIEHYGWTKTRSTLEEIMLAQDFDPVNAHLLLRDALLQQQASKDVLGEWFEKAIHGS